jgi:hypothetical protein
MIVYNAKVHDAIPNLEQRERDRFMTVCVVKMERQDCVRCMLHDPAADGVFGSS